MHHHSSPRRNVSLLATLIACSVGSLASAAILQIDARINAEVQQFDFGEPSSFDSAFEEFRTTAVVLPIQVTASLLPAPEDISTNAIGALAFSDFRDPTLSPEANPGEFGLEANVFSLDPFVSFAGTADATENRLVLFNATELETIEGETEREVESSVFVSGAVLIWSLDPARDLSGMSVHFDVSVDQELSGDSPVEVFSAFASIQGQAGGGVSFTASEGIDSQVGGSELLTEAIGPLGSQLEQELAGLGQVHVILIPERELTYRYTAPLDVEFNLVANISVTSTNLPAGTGAGAVFGRSFEELAQVIAEFIGQHSDGTLTQRAINKALANLQAQEGNGNSGNSTSTGGPGGCGMLGMELVVLPLGLLGLGLRGRRGV